MRGYDAVLSKLAQGYVDQGEYLGNFVAPVVSVNQRAGRYLKFGKEAFAATDTLRAPMTAVGFVESSFTHGTYNLEQHALGYRISEELDQESQSGEAKINLRQFYINDMMSRFQRAHEIRVFSSTIGALDGSVASANSFLAGTRNNTLTGDKLWSSAKSDPIYDVLWKKQRIADVIGQEPNSMVIGVNVNLALMTYGTHPGKDNRFYGDPGRKALIDLFGLSRGVKVANKQILDANGNLRYIFNPNAIYLFYAPDGSDSNGVLPSLSANLGSPAHAYTMQLTGYPKITTERFNEEYRYYGAEIIAERKVKVTSVESAMYSIVTDNAPPMLGI